MSAFKKWALDNMWPILLVATLVAVMSGCLLGNLLFNLWLEHQA